MTLNFIISYIQKQNKCLIITLLFWALFTNYIFSPENIYSDHYLGSFAFNILRVDGILIIYIIYNHNNITQKELVAYIVFGIIAMLVLKQTIYFILFWCSFIEPISQYILWTRGRIYDYIRDITTINNNNNGNNNTPNNNNNSNNIYNNSDPLDKKKWRGRHMRDTTSHSSQNIILNMSSENLDLNLIRQKVNKGLDWYDGLSMTERIVQMSFVINNIEKAKGMEEYNLLTFAVLKHEQFQNSQQSSMIKATDINGHRHSGWLDTYLESNHDPKYYHDLPKIGGMIQEKELVKGFLIERTARYRSMMKDD